MFEGLCTERELHVAILVLLLSLFVVATGKGGGKLLVQTLKKFLGMGSEVVSNVGKDRDEGDDMPNKPRPQGPFCRVPDDCPAHLAEHDRSLRNEKEIEGLWENYGQLRTDMTQGFKEVMANINATKDTILSALAGGRTGYGRSGKGGQEK